MRRYGPGGENDIIHESFISDSVLRKTLCFVKELNQQIMCNPDWEKDPEVRDAPLVHGFKAVINHDLKPTYVGACSRGDFVYEEESQLTDGAIQRWKAQVRLISLKRCCFGESTPIVGSLLEFSKTRRINQLGIICHNPSTVEKLKPQLKALLGDEVIMAAAIPRYLELAPREAGKAPAVRKLCSQLGYQLENIAYLGDGENDEGAMTICGHAIAMGNAIQRVKDRADVVTRSNDDDGWAIAVNELLDARRK
ncbi:uncharacterized protein LOC129617116 [Condylostylus longicornis]|uniref:uncharacterized protein LOC129617116 n=1 Tax=Condylostylus longicornis TaxID=2530218 RepID=UPI00244DCD9D|nr:uncharacterized protein LOC129617116 [Condylostylus longicornis]